MKSIFKAFIFVLSVSILLPIVLSGCAENAEPLPMNKTIPASSSLEEAFGEFSRIVEQGDLDGLRLRIYYAKMSIVCVWGGLSVDRILEDDSEDITMITVDSDRLAEHIDVLKAINEEGLTVIEGNKGHDSRICYVFENEGKNILTIAFGGAEKGVFVNGLGVKYDRRFRDLIVPFVSDDLLDYLEPAFINAAYNG